MLYGFALALTVALAVLAPAYPVQASDTTSPTQDEIIAPLLAGDVQLLVRHGVADDPGAIRRFLEAGFPAQKNLSEPPEEPSVRSALLVSAMAVASLRRYEGAREAMERLAGGGELAPGVERIVAHDARASLSSVADQRRRDILNTLRFNAVHALGVLGDPSAAPFLKRAYDAERLLSSRINLGLALAACGDAAALPFLIETLGDDNSQAASQAAEAVRLITGRHWRLTGQSAHGRKQAARSEAREWLKENTPFVPDRAALRERRLYPPDPPTLTVPPESLIDWIIIGARSPELSGDYTRMNAFQLVVSREAMAVDALSAIILDEMEDIDIRLFAMRAYVAIVRLERNFEAMKASALDLLRQATRSADGPVAEMARSLRENLRTIE